MIIDVPAAVVFVVVAAAAAAAAAATAAAATTTGVALDTVNASSVVDGTPLAHRSEMTCRPRPAASSSLRKLLFLGGRASSPSAQRRPLASFRRFNRCRLSDLEASIARTVQPQ